MSLKKIALISFTQKGKLLCERIKSVNGYEFFEASKPTKDFIKDNFNSIDGFIFVGAIGIAVRLTKDSIKSKDIDPAVIVLDENGEFVIPILSGHLGGANEIAIDLASGLNCTPVLTTATDINNKFAVDVFAKKNSMKVLNIDKIKNISSAVLRDEAINFSSDFIVEGEIPFIFDKTVNTGISISLEAKQLFETTLHLIPKIIVLGVGCRRDTKSKDFEEYVLKILKDNNISIHSVVKLASIDLKSNEKAILDFAKKYEIECEFFTVDELNEVDGDFTKSEFVKSITGVDNVCERSAVRANAQLILRKQSENGMTIALAKREWRCHFYK